MHECVTVCVCVCVFTSAKSSDFINDNPGIADTTKLCKELFQILFTCIVREIPVCVCVCECVCVCV